MSWLEHLWKSLSNLKELRNYNRNLLFSSGILVQKQIWSLSCVETLNKTDLKKGIKNPQTSAQNIPSLKLWPKIQLFLIGSIIHD